MNLIVVTGAPASGKYTIGKALSNQFGYKLLHNQLIVNLTHALFNFGSEGFKLMKQKVRKVCIESIQTHPPEGVIVTLCYGGSVSERFIEPLSKIAKSAHGVAIELPLNVERSVLLERVSAAERANMGKLTNEAILVDVLDNWPMSGVDCCTTLPEIETGNCAVDTSIEEAIRLISNQLR